MKIKFLQVLLMDNGEIICCGKTIGFTNTPGGGQDGKMTLNDFLYTADKNNFLLRK